MCMKTSNLLNQRFNRLTVAERAPSDKYGNSRWRCICDCGKERVAKGMELKAGKIKSCGCSKLEATVARNIAGTTHGHTKGGVCSRTFVSWACMRGRCKYPSDKQWKYYGGRGITVCERWESFENFLADMGERPPGRTLDRIDTDKGYGPTNCKWSTPLEQRANQRRKAQGA